MRNVYTFAGLTFALALAFSLTTAARTSTSFTRSEPGRFRRKDVSGGRRRSMPTQVLDMVGRGLDDDLVRHLRAAAPGDLHGEGVGGCGGRRSGEVQRRRSAGDLRADAGWQRAGSDRPLVGSAAAAGIDDRRIDCFDRAVGRAAGGDGDAGRHAWGH
jgi:hypothetical protein